MLLYEDPWFTFRFAEDRIIPRFHLEGVEVGRRVAVFPIDAGAGERLGHFASGVVGEDGWVELAEPIIVKAGDAFVAVPTSNCGAVIGGLFWFRRQPEAEVDKPR